MYNIDKEVTKMADNIRISPQGYVYGEEPLSDHPFWEEGPGPSAGDYVKEVSGSSATQGTVTTYSIKYTDQDDVEHDVIDIPVDSAGGGGSIPGTPMVIGNSNLKLGPAHRIQVSSTITTIANYYVANGTDVDVTDNVTVNFTPITERFGIVDITLDLTQSLRNQIVTAYGLTAPGTTNQYTTGVYKIQQIVEYSKADGMGEMEIEAPFNTCVLARTTTTGNNVGTWDVRLSVSGTFSLYWLEE